MARNVPAIAVVETAIAAATAYTAGELTPTSSAVSGSSEVARMARPSAVHFFHEFARRHGDYAIAGLTAQAMVKDGIFTGLRMAFFAVGDRPVLSVAMNKLVNAAITPALMADAGAALDNELDPHDDQQASGSMRRHLAKVLLTRCVSTLLGRPDLDARPG